MDFRSASGKVRLSPISVLFWILASFAVADPVVGELALFPQRHLQITMAAATPGQIHASYFSDANFSLRGEKEQLIGSHPEPQIVNLNLPLRLIRFVRLDLRQFTAPVKIFSVVITDDDDRHLHEIPLTEINVLGETRRQELPAEINSSVALEVRIPPLNELWRLPLEVLVCLVTSGGITWTAVGLTKLLPWGWVIRHWQSLRSS